MSAFLFYTRPDSVSENVTYLASNQLERAKVKTGDELWSVMTDAGKLTLQAHLRVSEVVGRADAERLLGTTDLWDSEFYAISTSPSELRRDLDITELVEQLEFEGSPAHLPANWTGQHLQTMRRLTPETAGLLQRRWEQREAPVKRNPPWQRDELILALDLYFRLDRRVPDEKEPEVVHLSELLNALPIHAHRPDEDRFRNPNGVALKLANFRALERPGTGMSRGGRLDQSIWEEFSINTEHLRGTADAIRRAYDTPEARPETAALEEVEETEFPEGRVIYRLHRARERNRKLAEAKKSAALEKFGKLLCEACGFDFGATYGAIGQGYIECHHTRPLSEITSETTTQLKDVVLLCANCHRIVHRKRPWLNSESIRALVAVS